MSNTKRFIETHPDVFNTINEVDDTLFQEQINEMLETDEEFAFRYMGLSAMDPNYNFYNDHPEDHIGTNIGTFIEDVELAILNRDLEEELANICDRTGCYETHRNFPEATITDDEQEFNIRFDGATGVVVDGIILNTESAINQILNYR